MPPRSRLRRWGLARLARQGYAAVNRRDFELVLICFAPGFEFRLAYRGLRPPDLPAIHHGHDGYLHAWSKLLEVFGNIRLEPEEAVDLGELLLVAIRMRGHGAGSGVPLDQPVYQLFTLRDGLVIRQVDFIDRSEALEAAGLRE